MKTILLICSGLLLLSIANLPIGYYTFLRIIVTIGAVTIIVKEYQGELNFWLIVFGLIAILFNPIIPVYFNNKSVWVPIDIIVAILFGIKSLTLKRK
ncbi:hypothetical protein ES677_01560 [Bizionia gelidisalsuginis]|uniref:Uncharacterized protein n=2 Tax=Bizionia TaxID=283785 RepID=A0A8H2LBP9_9FLAO|nr:MULTISPECIES: DUF6804 family protein [Bizionia]TYB72667.1 hypothetical protein ES676_10865 [Bizionia saleffrena]TYC18092.1 hypothetical protein ES677_01560 [Bizionia gelidisalsuginis]